MLKDIDFYHLQEIYLTNIEKSYWILKSTSKKVVHKTSELLGSKIKDAVTNSKQNKTKPVEEIIVAQERREEILKKKSQGKYYKNGTL